MAVQTVLVATVLASMTLAQTQFVEVAKRNTPLGAHVVFGSAVADFDGDGDPDLVLLRYLRLQVLRNDGAFRFTDVSSASSSASFSIAGSMLAHGDVDGDGDIDLVANDGTELVALLNDGRGRFVRSTGLQTDHRTPSSVAIADVDADGLADLIVGNSPVFQYPNYWLYGEDVVYRSLGNGRFAPSQVVSFRQVGTYAVLPGDVDGDGDVDLILAGGGVTAPGVELLLKNGRAGLSWSSGTLPPIPDVRSAASGDVDGDGDLDLAVVSWGLRPPLLFLNDGKGRYTDAIARLPALLGVIAVGTGDVDGDRRTDLVFGGSYRPWSVVHGGSFTLGSPLEVATSAGHVNLADLDGDRDADLIAGGFPVSLVFRNDGQGSFTDTTRPLLPLTGDRCAALDLIDVDGDLDLDLVGGFGDIRPGVRLYRNDGLGRFREDGSLPSATGIVRACGDIDGDGDVDLRSHAGMLLNDGTGRFTDVTRDALPDTRSATTARFFDADGDGDLDLVETGGVWLAHYDRLVDRLLVNDGAGHFTVAANQLPITTWSVHAVIDVDGDGDLDIVAAPWDDRLRLFVNDGRGRFSDSSARTPNQRYLTRRIEAGDVDNDGDADLVLITSLPSGSSQTSVRLLLYESGRFGDATQERLPQTSTAWSEALRFADIDDDGDLDLLIARGIVNVGERDELWLNDGKGFFRDATAGRCPSLPESTGAIAVGDIDGDGDVDVVWGSGDPSYGFNRLWVNRLRHLEVPYLPIAGSDLTLEVASRAGFAPGGEVAALLLGTSLTQTPIPGLGVWQVASPVVLLGAVVLPARSGIGVLRVPIPRNDALVGQPLAAQAFLLGVAGLGLTNPVAERVEGY